MVSRYLSFTLLLWLSARHSSNISEGGTPKHYHGGGVSPPTQIWSPNCQWEFFTSKSECSVTKVHLVQYNMVHYLVNQDGEGIMSSVPQIICVTFSNTVYSCMAWVVCAHHNGSDLLSVIGFQANYVWKSLLRTAKLLYDILMQKLVMLT